ncbi:MAG: hypothetical protein K6D97_02040 [Clostridia bacterium]|nr:hypothetical protein [Clostridia bacterium]
MIGQYTARQWCEIIKMYLAECFKGHDADVHLTDHNRYIGGHYIMNPNRKEYQELVNLLKAEGIEASDWEESGGFHFTPPYFKMLIPEKWWRGEFT